MTSPEGLPWQEDLFPHEPEPAEERYIPKKWKIGKSGKIENEKGTPIDDEVIEKAVKVVKRQAEKEPHIMDGDRLPDDLVRFYAITFQKEKNAIEEAGKIKNKKRK